MLLCYLKTGNLKIDRKNKRFMKLAFGSKARLYIDIETDKSLDAIVPPFGKTVNGVRNTFIVSKNNYVPRYNLKHLAPYISKSNKYEKCIALVNITLPNTLKLVDLSISDGMRIIKERNCENEYSLVITFNNSTVNYLFFKCVDINERQEITLTYSVTEEDVSSIPSTPKILTSKDFDRNYNIEIFRPAIPSGIIISDEKIDMKTRSILESRFNLKRTKFIYINDNPWALKEIEDAIHKEYYSAATFLVNTRNPSEILNLPFVKNFRYKFQLINFVTKSGHVFYIKNEEEVK